MLNLRFWLSEQGLSVRELASGLDVPLPTVEDWVYRGAAPSPHYAELLIDFVSATCAHHGVIEAANGPLSEGICQRCGEEREFSNSADTATTWWPIRSTATESASNES